MKDREKIKQVSDTIIETTDVKYMAHYWFENLEGAVMEEIENNITNCSRPEIEDILDNVYRYVIKGVQVEMFNFIRYSLPEYILTLYNKQITDGTGKNG